ncbi:MAG: hypothetical protein ABIG87_03280 [Patescibacteria group bacterium]
MFDHPLGVASLNARRDEGGRIASLRTPREDERMLDRVVAPNLEVGSWILEVG